MYILFIFLLLWTASAVAEEIHISEIEVSGNINIAKDFIISNLGFALPADMGAEDIALLAEKLYKTELFAGIDIGIDNGTMKIDVIENPVVREINFVGNKKIKRKVLLSVLPFKANDVLTERDLHESINAIVLLYNSKGRFDTIVKPRTIATAKDGVVDVVFEISEAKKLKIRRIDFYGNNIFSTDQLRDVIGARPNLWRRIFGNNIYREEKLSSDAEALKYFYGMHGYANFSVISIAKEICKDGLYVSFIVDEGKLYNFGRVSLQSAIERVDVDYLLANLSASAGEIYNHRKVDNDLRFIREYLYGLDYAFAEVFPYHSYNADDHTVEIEYFISADIKNYLNKITISGNTRTDDEVIRREMLLSEGDPYSAGAAARSRRRISNLNFFSKVDFLPKKSEEGVVDLEVKVEEKKTGEFNFGFGISSNGNISGNFYIKERNLFGRGQEALFFIQRMRRGYDLELGMRDPYVFGKRISGGFNISLANRDYQEESSYSMNSVSGSVYTAYGISENLRGIIRYSYGVSDINNVPDDASIYIKDQAGKNITSLIGYELSYNKLDSAVAPSSGYLLSFSQGLAGLGGDSKYISSEFSGRYFNTLDIKNNKLGDIILQTKFKTAYISSYDNAQLRINERFFVGSNEVRGFEVGGIGPRDSVTGDALGAKFYAASTWQISKQIRSLSRFMPFKVFAFFDAGTAFGIDKDYSNILDISSIRTSVGFGGVVTSPMGPMRVDFGFPISQEDFDKTKIVRFGFGQEF
ncbi:outer membrane protein assembly factor BamA [Rickettsiales bacterium]|nr:outer membrane protein assembly factor BamA [Rickettsiales bacterium]